MLYHIGGFVTGAALSSVFVFNMNDIIYTQLRRNIILPFSRLANKQDGQGGLDKENMQQLGKGTINFMTQFKPLGLQPQSAKSLLMTDQQYGTPSDSYFAFIGRRKRESVAEEEKENQVISQLGLEKVLPPYYNVAQNKFEIQTSDKALINDIREINPDADIDEIEVARINAIRQQNIDRLLENKLNEISQEPSQKFTKKDYQRLNTLSFTQIMKNLDSPTEKRRYQDQDLQALIKEENLPENMIKIERKKKAKKSREERKRAQEEINRLLQNPQDIEGRDRAVQIAEQQNIEAKEISNRDIKRLRRLKKKAEKLDTTVRNNEKSQSNITSLTQIENTNILNTQEAQINKEQKRGLVQQEAPQNQQIEKKSQIKIEHGINSIDIDNQTLDNVDDLIK